MGNKEWFQVCSPQVQSRTLHCTPVSGSETPILRIGNTLLPVEESTKFLGLWWDSHLSFKKHISVLKTQCKEALNIVRVVAHLKWGGDRDTLLMLYRAVVRSKLDYGCIVYGTASNTNLRQLDRIHNSGLRLALGAFCTSPVFSLYTEANKAPLEEGRLKLSMHYYVKTRACIDNPAHHALHEFDRTTRDLYAPRPNGRGGMTRPPASPIGLKVEEAMTSAEINAELVCPLRTPNFPPGMHDYDPKRHDLVDSLNALFETIPETCIVEFLREAGFFYLIWCNLLTSTSSQTWTIWSDLSNC